eukprot:1141352-Pelagomonas_calceolata.AAC.2
MFPSKQQIEGVWHANASMGRENPTKGNIDAPCVNSSWVLCESPRKQHVQYRVRLASTESTTRKSSITSSMFVTRTG